jgi:hypothetical protein
VSDPEASEKLSLYKSLLPDMEQVSLLAHQQMAYVSLLFRLLRRRLLSYKCSRGDNQSEIMGSHKIDRGLVG